MPTSSPQFAGFSDGALRFLVRLDKNNRREWFNERKAFYKETVEEELRRLVWSTSAALAKKKIPLSTEPQRAIFRIYRDTRFSADKRPYKTNLGAVFTTGGKPGSGVLYVHVEPKASFEALGFYQPDQPGLTRIREAIADRWKELKSVINRLDRAGLTLRDSDSLKRVPRGFESFADAECAQYLKYKSFIVSRQLTETDLRSPELPSKLTLFASEGLPLLKFGWTALGRG
ncbi:MAG: DUF2461 domain-containing protein [Chthoniobacterales bacterium]